MPSYTSLKDNYQHLYDTMCINPAAIPELTFQAAKIRANKERYEHIVQLIPGATIPWYFIGILHMMECTLSFRHHLHNGDPLTARTIHVPSGRPLTGNPPFTFEQSAVDALKLKELDLKTDWSVPIMLYRMEGYNGYGYHKRFINSPYLWAGSNQYTRGKYVKDGVFDPDAVSKQIGTALLLRQLIIHP